MEFFKKRSTAWAVLAIVIVVSFFIGQARGPGATPELETLPSGMYVQDTAGVLSSSTEKYITEMNNGLVSAVNAEIQVATVDTTGSKDIYDLAYELAVETNLSANCCVFVIAVDDVDALILQGDDLIYEFSDSELSAILNRNFTVRDFEKRNVDDAVRNSFADLIGMYENLYGVRITGSANIVKQSGSTSSYSSAFTVLMMILFIVLLIVVVMAITRPGRRRTVVVPTGHVGRTTPPRSGNYPPRGSYTTPPPYSSRSGGFGGSTKSKGGSFSSSSRSGGFGSSSRGGSFGSSSRSGGFGGSRGGSFGGGSRGGSFGGSRGGGFRK